MRIVINTVTGEEIGTIKDSPSAALHVEVSNPDTKEIISKEVEAVPSKKEST